MNTFQDILEAFVGHYLCFAYHKQNISTLQNIKLHDSELLIDFMKRVRQAMLYVESHSMDVILHIYKQSIGPGTPFFEFLAKKPPTMMDDLFRQVDKYFILEDDVRATTQ